VDKIKMDLGEIGGGGVNWIGLAYECGNKPCGSINCWKVLE
jgi:hypothetical protein